jgi:hypothetical protein
MISLAIFKKQIKKRVNKKEIINPKIKINNLSEVDQLNKE